MAFSMQGQQPQRHEACLCLNCGTPAKLSAERLPAESPMCSRREVQGSRGLSIQLQAAGHLLSPAG